VARIKAGKKKKRVDLGDDLIAKVVYTDGGNTPKGGRVCASAGVWTTGNMGRGFPSCDFVSFVVDELGIPRLIRGVHSNALFR
jgi:hypothetical protein